MTLSQKLINEFEELTDDQKIEVIDFTEFLKEKNKKNIEALMDKIILENKEALEAIAK